MGIAAAQGHSGAQYNLGVCFQYGHGVEIDLKEAWHFYELAAAQGEQGAKRALKIIEGKMN